MDWVRIYLLAGLIIHKALWESLKRLTAQRRVAGKKSQTVNQPINLRLVKGNGEVADGKLPRPGFDQAQRFVRRFLVRGPALADLLGIDCRRPGGRHKTRAKGQDKEPSHAQSC